MRTMTSPRRTSTDTNRGAFAGRREGLVGTVTGTGELAAVTIATSRERNRDGVHGSIVASRGGGDICTMSRNCRNFTSGADWKAAGSLAGIPPAHFLNPRRLSRV